MNARQPPLTPASQTILFLPNLLREVLRRRRPRTLQEEDSKENLKEVYEDPVWENFYNRIDDLIKSLIEKRERKEKHTPVPEGEVEVKLDSRYYGRCPRCGNSFNYDERDIGRLVRCRSCSLPMRLKWVGG